LEEGERGIKKGRRAQVAVVDGEDHATMGKRGHAFLVRERKTTDRGCLLGEGVRAKEGREAGMLG
jgi:cytosine/adenosine deaminase-related metal-dependent hydrolase